MLPKRFRTDKATTGSKSGGSDFPLQKWITFQSQPIGMLRFGCELGWKGISEDMLQPNSRRILADLLKIKSSRKKYTEVR